MAAKESANDYSAFLHVMEDGGIWWRTEDAIKLAAGYRPIRDDQRNLVPILRATTNQVRANERTLIGALSEGNPKVAHPRSFERDGRHYIEAHEFLLWLTKYLTMTQAVEIPFPNDLARAVRDAVRPPATQTLREHIKYPEAIKLLRQGLPNVTPEEMAMWVFMRTKADRLNALSEKKKEDQTVEDLGESEWLKGMGTKDCGLAAYKPGKESDPPHRFRYEYSGHRDHEGHLDDLDYLRPLRRCRFRKDDITTFDPAERYITYKDLNKRWSNLSDLLSEEYIEDMITEERLTPLHPITGGTQGILSGPGYANLPPLESGLFELSKVEKIEAEDFGEKDSGLPASASRGGATPDAAPESGQLDGIGDDSQDARLPGSVTRLSIRRTGQIWTLTYQGSATQHKDSKGLRYIDVLTRSPRKPIDVDELYRKVNPSPTDNRSDQVSKYNDAELENEGLVKGNLTSAEPAMDAKALRSIKDKVTVLKDKIEDAKKNGNEARQQTLEEEVERIEKYLRANLRKDGRARVTNPETEKARNAVQKAIRRAIKDISEQDKELGKYLDTCIKTGSACSYVPLHLIPIADNM